MKKKFFLKFFLFTVIATLVTFTSCKDYDDDISRLDNEIANLSGVKTDLTAVKADIAAAQASAAAAQTAANDALAKANEALQAAQNAGDADAIEAAQTAADNAQAAADAAQAKVDDVEAEAERLLGLIDALEGRVTALEGVDNPTQADLQALSDEVQALKAQVAEMGGLELNNLVIIPDFVADRGGALPILNFAPLVTPCGEISPATLVRYQVSPTNASVDLIDKDNLYFKYNNPTVVTYAADLNPKAEFVSLVNGVLTVRAFIDTDALPALEGTDKITTLQLFVPTTSGNEVVSDWAKVISQPIDPLALVRKPAIVDEDIDWSDYQLAETLADAKALEITHETVVDLAYDETLDLLEVVKTMITTGAWGDFNLDTYNLVYAFDLKDEDGNTIVFESGTNNTDQQKFLNLVGSEVSTRVYDLDGANPASIDRTPIVHVMLKSKDGAVACNVLDGFIKINIVEAKVEPVPPVTIPVTGNVEAGCDDFTLRVGTKQMNEEFYAKAKVSKTFFHDNYDWIPETDGVGTITEVADLEDTQSFNLVWTVTSAELAANLDQTITKSGMYKYGNNEIKVTFTAEVTQPSVNLGALTLDNYWSNNNSFVKFNTTVPTSTTDDDEANNTFDTNINNVFKTVSNSDLRLDLPAGHTYEYFFDKKENQPVKTYNGITISVSTDGKELLATRGTVTETVATILPQTAADGDILLYNQGSDLAKELLNAGVEFMKARLYIEVKRVCEESESTIVLKVKGLNNGDAFDVHFLRPVNVEGQAAEAFIDGVDSGKPGSFINLIDIVNLSDWRNNAKNSTDYYFADNLNYYGFYDVTNITIDTDNIVPVGLKVGGVDLDELPGTIDIDTTGATSTTDFGTLTYRNNGAGLDNNFILKVPVTVTYKWGEVSTIVEVEVKKTAASESIL